MKPTNPARVPAALLLALLLLLPGLAGAQAPRLESDSAVATAGYYRLSWQGEAGRFLLEEATRADFADARVLYQGADLATLRSGQPDGDYYYRIRALHEAGPSPWSEAVHVEVRHHPLSRALTFLLLGAIVFLATLVLILRGETLTRSRPEGL
ncbi:MAG: fibronectin type III domain-containing protein [Chromatiales bacterium]|nr:fibronectin type III domain-containing protein [Chromatiales bacterium]